MNDLVLVALVILATYRLTLLVIDDRVLQRPRDAIQTWAEYRWERQHMAESASDEWSSGLAYLLSCGWCASIYVGGAVTLITDLVVGLPAPLLVWPASSAVAGHLRERGR